MENCVMHKVVEPLRQILQHLASRGLKPFPASPFALDKPMRAAQATHISASAWSNITAAIDANPEVDWQIIVNPNSGPGTSSPPDANYIDAISKLNSFQNVATLGYIATGYTQVPYTTVASQIDIYAQWADYDAANISVSGIFFDEANNTAANDVYEYYQQAHPLNGQACRHPQPRRSGASSALQPCRHHCAV
ncbi:MAG: hypothetical protein Q9174_005322 [Haloplaca sp. 1 TL-2023]